MTFYLFPPPLLCSSICYYAEYARFDTIGCMNDNLSMTNG